MDDERIRATDDESPVWRSKTGDIKLSEMDNKYLQNILNFSQEREMYFFNRMMIFTDKINEIQEEAEKRGIQLTLKTDKEFYVNQQHKPSK